MANRALRNIIIRCIILLVIVIHRAFVVNGARSLTARRVIRPRSTNRYDRSITAFDPDGRLLQLEYALTAAEERGMGLSICVEWNGNVIFAFPSTDSSVIEEESLFDTLNDNAPVHNSKIHRLSPTHLLFTSGLAGDARTLASAFRGVIATWTHQNYGEVASTRDLAAEMGKVRHSIGLRPGARVLGVIGLLIGLDENGHDDSPAVRMYRSLPGGTIDRCYVSCTGGGADGAGVLSRKQALELLTNIVNDPTVGVSTELPTNEEELQNIMEKVAQVAFNAQSHENDFENKLKLHSKVDIWLVRASESKRTPQRKETFSSLYRHHGKSSMDIRYARHVSLTQLTIAAQSLIHKPTKFT